MACSGRPIAQRIRCRREARYIAVVPPVRFKQEALDSEYNWGMSREAANPKG